MKETLKTAKNRKQKRSIKQIIVRYMTMVSVTLGVVLVFLMIAASTISTSSVLCDSLQHT